MKFSWEMVQEKLIHRKHSDRLSSDEEISVKFLDLNYDKNPRTNEFDKVSPGKLALNPNYVYRIAHTVLIADAIISVPKLKTHTRLGITCMHLGARK